MVQQRDLYSQQLGAPAQHGLAPNEKLRAQGLRKLQGHDRGLAFWKQGSACLRRECTRALQLHSRAACVHTDVRTKSDKLFLDCNSAYLSIQFRPGLWQVGRVLLAPEAAACQILYISTKH